MKFNYFELILIGIVTIISGIFLMQSYLCGDYLISVVNFVAAVSGMLSVVLCAKGKKSGFIFGLINVVLYATVSFIDSYYGEVMLNVLFYIPMNIISYVSWSKHENKNNTANAKSLRLPTVLILAVVISVITYLYHLFLVSIGGSMTLLDGTTTILSVCATILMWLRYSEQWLCWIIIDVLTTILWTIAGNSTMIIMWSAYTINAIYGYVIWLNRSGKLRGKIAAKIASASE